MEKYESPNKWLPLAIAAAIALTNPFMIFAVAFSLGYALTGSLRVPIVMHAVFNAINLGRVLLFPDIVNSVGP